MLMAEPPSSIIRVEPRSIGPKQIVVPVARLRHTQNTAGHPNAIVLSRSEQDKKVPNDGIKISLEADTRPLDAALSKIERSLNGFSDRLERDSDFSTYEFPNSERTSQRLKIKSRNQKGQ